MNDSSKKMINLVFRLLIFACFAMAIVLVVNIVKFAVIMNKNSSAEVGEFSSAVRTFATLYNGIFFATIAGVVLSILAKYKCKTVSQVARTLFLAVTAAAMGLAFRVTSAFIEVCDVLDELDTTDFNSITDSKLIDVGISAERADEIAELMSKDSTPVFLAAGMCVCVLVYLILTFTSLHNLLKKDKSAGQ